MATENRKRWVYAALLIVTAAFIFDRFLLDTYLEKRKELANERDSKTAAVRNAGLTLQKEKQLREFLNGAGSSLSLDASAIEGQLLHSVQEWEQEAKVSNSSFQRLGMMEDHGFTRVTFQISTTGLMPSVAAFLYRVETSAIPLRIDSTQIRPKSEIGDQLQVQVTVSALCHDSIAKTAAARIASGANATGADR